MDKWKDEYPLFYQAIVNEMQSQTLSHSYLFEYDSLDEILVFVKDFIKSILSNNYFKGIPLTDDEEKMCYQIDHDLYDDCIWIYPDGNWIKKEQLNRLQHIYQTKSLHNTFRIYVIVGAERLNTTSANTILKFLEEPNGDIVALLLTTNKYEVLNTIYSRCQFYSLKKVKDSEILSVEQLHLELVQEMEEKKKDALLDIYVKYQVLFENKEKFIETVDILKQIYSEALSENMNQTKLTDNPLYNLINLKNNVGQLTKKIFNLITTKKLLLTTNVNIKNYLEKFILEFVEEQ